VNFAERFDKKFSIILSIKNAQKSIPHALASFKQYVSNACFGSNITGLYKVRNRLMQQFILTFFFLFLAINQLI
jgi:hypothetical protein